jgi:radical SAM protein with 4Fe4S-binding SPASM domain
MSRTLRMLKSFVDPRQVGYVIFYVTNRCNFRCQFCFYLDEVEQGLKPEELTIDEIDRTARKLGPLLQLSLTGGEPFIRSDFAEITHLFVRHCSPRYITIPTNAWLTDAIVTYLEEVLPAHPDSYVRLTFSIEGIGADHDEIRSKPGSYARIQESYAAIAPLRKRFRNLVLDANAVFTARTEDTLLATLKTLSTEFAFDNLSVTYARGTLRDPAMISRAREKYVEVNDFLEQLARTKETRLLYPVWRGVRDVSRQNLVRTVFDDEFVTPCVAGKKLIVIGETGEVYPCEILGKSMGNLRASDFDVYALLNRSSSQELVDWIESSHCKCSFECALGANIVWNASMYPRLAASAVRNIGRRGAR